MFHTVQQDAVNQWEMVYGLVVVLCHDTVDQHDHLNPVNKMLISGNGYLDGNLIYTLYINFICSIYITNELATVSEVEHSAQNQKFQVGTQPSFEKPNNLHVPSGCLQHHSLQRLLTYICPLNDL